MSILDRFRRREIRSSATDTLVAALLARAAGTTPATVTATAAVEAAAGLYGRAFAGARVEGPAPMVAALSPSVLCLIARELIRRGEALFVLRVMGGRVMLVPCATWTVFGGPDADAWSYEATVHGPNRTETVRELPPEAVAHFMYAVDPARPWHGLGPVQFAAIAGRLDAETAAALADESGGPVAQFVPVPVDGQDSTVAALRTDVADAKGRALLVEAQNHDWAASSGGRGAARMDWRAERLGANPPASLVALAAHAEKSVLGACGVPPDLVGGDSSAVAARESWRRFLVSSVAPIGRQVVEELRRKLDPGIDLGFPELQTSDLASRARAFGTLTKAGMMGAEARRIVGFEG